MVKLLCLECSQPYETEDLGDERCRACKRLERIVNYHREYSKRRYHEVIKQDPYLLDRHRKTSRDSQRRARERKAANQ